MKGSKGSALGGSPEGSALWWGFGAKPLTCSRGNLFRRGGRGFCVARQGHGGRHAACRLPQRAVTQRAHQVPPEPRQQSNPARPVLAPDIEPVAHEIEPARARPADALLRADLVADLDVAAIAHAPAAGARAQAKIEFLPAEEQHLIVAAGVVPRGAPDRVAGTDERRRIEGFCRAAAAGAEHSPRTTDHLLPWQTSRCGSRPRRYPAPRPPPRPAAPACRARRTPRRCPARRSPGHGQARCRDCGRPPRRNCGRAPPATRRGGPATAAATICRLSGREPWSTTNTCRVTPVCASAELIAATVSSARSSARITTSAS